MHALQQALSPPNRLDSLPVIRDVVFHCQARVLVWPVKGVIYGRAGTPIGGTCADGYVRLGGGRGRHQYAHRVVYEAANGPIPPGLEINHVNGRKADNRLSNLELVTRRQNAQHAMEMGLIAIGSECGISKLTEDLVCAIRASDRPASHWARELGVDASSVRDARRGTTWRHVVCRGRRAVQGRRKRRARLRRATPGAAS
jgi:hypothetical protein